MLHSASRDGYNDLTPLSAIPETLPSVLARNNFDPKRYNVLVLDTQGSELMILRGAQDLLSGFRYIKTEAADFESYTGCARGDDIIDYLSRFGFRLLRKDIVAHRDAGGTYFDLLFGREEEGQIKTPDRISA